MSKNKRSKTGSSVPVASILLNEQGQSYDNQAIGNQNITGNTTTKPNNQSRFVYLKKHWWVSGLIAVLVAGAFGAGMKYLEDSAKQQLAQPASADKKNNGSLLSAINPFTPPLTPTPTPQLSKEYIYAGSRMLAVEDANASAAPPADLAVWRLSKSGAATWHVMGGTGSQAVSYGWGALDDIPVPGDYDGDGKTDFSVFRVTNNAGTWFIVRSSDSTSYSLQFGAGGDKPAPADYDGDGKTDAALYRVDTVTQLATWYIQRSSLGLISQAFGAAGDIPSPADYDGDGKADIAVRRNGDLKFYVLRSSDNTVQAQLLGASGDVPVSADYDGDGTADFALKSGTSWVIRSSSSGLTATTTPSWEQAGDIPVQNDYDGDGLVDMAVWRESNGNWYIKNSTTGSLRQEAWGQNGDKPVPAFYRR